MLVSGAVLLLVGFQNCGRGFQTLVNGISSSASSSSNEIMRNKTFLARQLELLISMPSQYSSMTTLTQNLPTSFSSPETVTPGQLVKKAKGVVTQLLPRQQLGAKRLYKVLLGSAASSMSEYQPPEPEEPCYSSTDSGIDIDDDHYFTENTFNLNCLNEYFNISGSGHISDTNDADPNGGTHLDFQNFSFLMNYEGSDLNLSFTSFVGDFSDSEGNLQFQNIKSQSGTGDAASGLDCESLQFGFAKTNTSFNVSYDSRMCRSSTVVCDSRVEMIKQNSVRIAMVPDSGMTEEPAEPPMQVTMQVDGLLSLERAQDISYSGSISLHLVRPSASCPSGVDSGSGLIRMDLENAIFEVRNCSCTNETGCDLYINGQKYDSSTMTAGNPATPVSCEIHAKAFEMHPNAPGLSEDFYAITYWPPEDVSPMAPYDFDPYLIPITVDSRTLNNSIVTVDPTDETLGVTYPKLFLDGTTRISSYKMIGDGERTIDDYHLLSQVMAYYIPNRQATKAKSNSGWYIDMPLNIRPHCQQMLNAFYGGNGSRICMGYFGPLEFSFEGPMLAHEIGHANFHWASRYIYEPNANEVVRDQNVYCRTTHGCIRAIDEGQADFHAVLLFGRGDHLFDFSQLPGRDPARNSNLKCGNTEDLEIHGMGSIYAAIWWNLLQSMGPDATAKLFYAHLPILSHESTFVSALVATQVVDSAIQDQYEPSDRQNHAAMIEAAFRAHGITHDGCVVDE